MDGYSFLYTHADTFNNRYADCGKFIDSGSDKYGYINVDSGKYVGFNLYTHTDIFNNGYADCRGFAGFHCDKYSHINVYIGKYAIIYRNPNGNRNKCIYIYSNSYNYTILH